MSLMALHIIWMMQMLAEAEQKKVHQEKAEEWAEEDCDVVGCHH